jgi:hypothetical protein
MANGRFTEVTNGAAVFALPDPGLAARASNFLGEAESALAAHFGQPVPLRLVVDPGSAPPKEPSEPPPGTDEVYDLDDLDDLTDASGAPVVSVEQRILEAFPGSVVED